MEITWLLAGLLAVCLSLTLMYRKKLMRLQTECRLQQMLERQIKAADLAQQLRLLAREISNELLQRDPDGFSERFEQLVDEWWSVKNSSDEAKKAQLKSITNSYVTFADFHLGGGKPHRFLYSDVFESYDNQELWAAYRDIRLYSALMTELDEHWAPCGLTITLDESKALARYCTAMRNTELVARLKKAYQVLRYLLRSEADAQTEKEAYWAYETYDYKFRAPVAGETGRWGVYVKELEEFGVISIHFDTAPQFHGSDERFSSTVSLHTIRSYRARF